MAENLEFNFTVGREEISRAFQRIAQLTADAETKSKSFSAQLANIGRGPAQKALDNLAKLLKVILPAALDQLIAKAIRAEGVFGKLGSAVAGALGSAGLSRLGGLARAFPGATGGLIGIVGSAAFGTAITLLDKFKDRMLATIRTLLSWQAQLVAAGATFGLIFSQRAFLQAGAQIESLTASFEGFTSGANAAREEVEELVEFARDTPFELPGLSDAQRRLLTFGLAGENTLRVLAEAATGSRVGVSDAAEAFIAASNRSFRAIRALGISARTAGDQIVFTFVDRFGALRKVAAENSQAIIASTLEAILNEKYLGSMARFRGSYEDLLSNLQARWFDFQRFVTERAGMFDAVKAAFTVLVDFIDRRQDVFENLGRVIANVFNSTTRLAVTALGAIEPFLKGSLALLEGVQGAVADQGLLSFLTKATIAFTLFGKEGLAAYLGLIGASRAFREERERLVAALRLDQPFADPFFESLRTGTEDAKRALQELGRDVVTDIGAALGSSASGPISQWVRADVEAAVNLVNQRVPEGMEQAVRKSRELLAQAGSIISEENLDPGLVRELATRAIEPLTLQFEELRASGKLTDTEIEELRVMLDTQFAAAMVRVAESLRDANSEFGKLAVNIQDLQRHLGARGPLGTFFDDLATQFGAGQDPAEKLRQLTEQLAAVFDEQPIVAASREIGVAAQRMEELQQAAELGIPGAAEELRNAATDMAQLLSRLRDAPALGEIADLGTEQLINEARIVGERVGRESLTRANTVIEQGLIRFAPQVDITEFAAKVDTQLRRQIVDLETQLAQARTESPLVQAQLEAQRVQRVLAIQIEDDQRRIQLRREEIEKAHHDRLLAIQKESADRQKRVRETDSQERSAILNRIVADETAATDALRAEIDKQVTAELGPEEAALARARALSAELAAQAVVNAERQIQQARSATLAQIAESRVALSGLFGREFLQEQLRAIGEFQQAVQAAQGDLITIRAANERFISQNIDIQRRRAEALADQHRALEIELLDDERRTTAERLHAIEVELRERTRLFAGNARLLELAQASAAKQTDDLLRSQSELIQAIDDIGAASREALVEGLSQDLATVEFKLKSVQQAFSNLFARIAEIIRQRLLEAAIESALQALVRQFPVLAGTLSKILKIPTPGGQAPPPGTQAGQGTQVPAPRPDPAAATQQQAATVQQQAAQQQLRVSAIQIRVTQALQAVAARFERAVQAFQEAVERLLAGSQASQGAGGAAKSLLGGLGGSRALDDFLAGIDTFGGAARVILDASRDAGIASLDQRTAAAQNLSASIGQGIAGRLMTTAAAVMQLAALNMLASANGNSGVSVGSAQQGGITTQEGLVKVHPQEAIIPLDRLGATGVNIQQTIVFERGGAVRSDSQGDGDPRQVERMTRFFELMMIETIREQQRPGGILENTGPAAAGRRAR